MAGRTITVNSGGKGIVVQQHQGDSQTPEQTEEKCFSVRSQSCGERHSFNHIFRCMIISLPTTTVAELAAASQALAPVCKMHIKEHSVSVRPSPHRLAVASFPRICNLRVAQGVNAA